MGRFAPLMIPRSEWERIKNLANPETKIEMPCKVDIEAMNAQSRKWTSTWPDTSQGKVNKMTKKDKKTRLVEMAEVEAFYKKKKRDNTAENLKRAKAMIFERTGYGKELLSALIESKTLEERDIQIKFKKDIEAKEKKIEEAKLKVDNIMFAEFEKRENERLLKKIKEREDAECNKIIAEMKKEEALRTAQIEKQHRLEDNVLIEKFLQLQIAEEKHDPCIDKEADRIYEEQDKAIRDTRKTREALDQKLADLWRKYQDRIRCREKRVFDQMHKEKHNTGHFKDNYELVQRLQEEEERKYNDFVEKGVKRLEKRLQKEQQVKVKLDQPRTKTEYKQANNEQECENYQRKCCVDKQSFLPTRRSKLDAKLISLRESQPRRPPPRPQFQAPSTALQDALKQRQAQSSGWSGTAAAHEQFARYAEATLKEAVYKRPVQKVVDSYCKTNNVNLQIPNY